MKTFGQRMLEARRRAGLSQQEIAARLGTSGTVVGRYERGHVTPSVEVAWKVAQLLGVTLDSLCGGSELADGPQDKAMLERLRQIEQLDPRERDSLLFFIDGVLRDAMTRRAYGQPRAFGVAEVSNSQQPHPRRKVGT